MKLIIQIPCLNEEKTLPLVLKELPKKLNGISSIEVVVIDDGSTDKTSQVAKKYGCRVLKHKKNKGLGFAFKAGLEYALEKNVDILVNTDADNQYPSKYIKDLVKPIVDKKADLVISDRQTSKVKHFSLLKKFFQFFGSFLVRRLTETDVKDTVSGFRAYSKNAMYNLHITTKFSYVLDTIMQLSKKNMRIINIPIKINKPTRKSRLFKNMFQHIRKSGINLLRLYAIYEPFKTFTFFSLFFFIPGFLLGVRFIFYLLQGLGDGHIQSLIATAILIITSVMLFTLGIIGELLKTNRTLIEENYTFNKRRNYEQK
jgi:glycosyltransferase involved in cell wall biosynthesis